MAKLDKLITYAFFKEENDLPDNIEDRDIERKILDSQEMLRMVMSDPFYQDFLTNYKNNTFSVVYTALYDPYIKQFVARQAYEFYVSKANFKPTRGGFRVHTEENSVIATDVQMASLIKEAKMKAQYYKELLLGFLKQHATDYPLYNVACNANNLAGNGFHITAVKNKHKEPHLYGGRRRCCS